LRVVALHLETIIILRFPLRPSYFFLRRRNEQGNQRLILE
jgi:hypothetical protein